MRVAGSGTARGPNGQPVAAAAPIGVLTAAPTSSGAATATAAAPPLLLTLLPCVPFLSFEL